MTSDDIPKIVRFGENALACFSYFGRGICPGTIFGTHSAKALLAGNMDAMPMAPIQRYSERFNTAKAAYYEFGATLTHAVTAPFV